MIRQRYPVPGDVLRRTNGKFTFIVTAARGDVVELRMGRKDGRPDRRCKRHAHLRSLFSELAALGWEVT